MAVGNRKQKIFMDTKSISKVKAIHINTDYKFVDNFGRFKGPYFDNTVIGFYSGEEPYTGPYQESVKFFNKRDIGQVIELCKTADFVVLYDLDPLKCQIALALPPDIKIAWRFFGHELYNGMRNEILDRQSLDFLLTEQKKHRIKNIVKDIFRPVYHKLKYGEPFETIFHKTFLRIDYMLVMCTEEHNYLSKYWKNLPDCIPLYINAGNFGNDWPEIDLSKKKKKIILGNSRNITNNHLEMIEMIGGTKKKREYRFQLLFNYGNDGDYANAVKQAIRERPYFEIIEEFIPKEEFKDFYRDVSAMVINSYRQMAMGNLFFALKNGVKVYLNRRNVIMDWLLENGVQVYSTKSLVPDIENNNILLDQSTAWKNLENLNKIYKNYTREDFQKTIYHRVKMGDV